MFIMIINPKTADVQNKFILDPRSFSDDLIAFFGSSVSNTNHHYIRFHRRVIREAVESEFGFPHGACFNRYILYELLDKIKPK